MPPRAARIDPDKRTQLLTFFAKDLTATQAGDLAGVNRNTANLWFMRFRRAIADQAEIPRLSGKIEIDQAAFGHKGRKKKAAQRRLERWQKPKKGKPENNELQVFGLLERKGRVYTHVIQSSHRDTLIPIIHMVVEASSTLYSDEHRSFRILKEDGYRHYRVNHSRGYSKRGVNINGIEAFWSFSKRRLLKFNGLPKSTLLLHVKECEFRYNNRGKVLPAIKEILIKKTP